jgi:hypothetical protein
MSDEQTKDDRELAAWRAKREWVENIELARREQRRAEFLSRRGIQPKSR